MIEVTSWTEAGVEVTIEVLIVFPATGVGLIFPLFLDRGCSGSVDALRLLDLGLPRVIV